MSRVEFSRERLNHHYKKTMPFSRNSGRREFSDEFLTNFRQSSDKTRFFGISSVGSPNTKEMDTWRKCLEFDRPLALSLHWKKYEKDDLGNYVYTECILLLDRRILLIFCQFSSSLSHGDMRGIYNVLSDPVKKPMDQNFMSHIPFVVGSTVLCYSCFRPQRCD